MIDAHGDSYTNGSHHVLEADAIVVPSTEPTRSATCLDCGSQGPDLPVGRRWVCLGCAQDRVNEIVTPVRLCCSRIKGGHGWCMKPDKHSGDCDGVISSVPPSTDFGARGKR